MQIAPNANASNLDWEDSWGKLVPLSVPLFQVAPPPSPAHIMWVEPMEFDFLENVNIIQPPLTRTIDEATHQSLLHQSLQDYKDIWEDLAKR